MDVLELVARGYSNKRIARALGLAEGTVKLHVGAVLKALGVVNRTQAAFEATALGLVSAAVPGQLTIGDVGS
ncbi:MAG: response regulator transcription factor [Rhodospirillales bacterium]|nr:response regulator transcription factor [Rhodospirillales bacterium]